MVDFGSGSLTCESCGRVGSISICHSFWCTLTNKLVPNFMLVLWASVCVIGGVGTVEAIAEAGALGDTVSDLVHQHTASRTLGHALDHLHLGRFFIIVLLFLSCGINTLAQGHAGADPGFSWGGAKK